MKGYEFYKDLQSEERKRVREGEADAANECVEVETHEECGANPAHLKVTYVEGLNIVLEHNDIDGAEKSILELLKLTHK